MKLKFILFVLSLFTCGSVLSANLPTTFEEIDSDADGYISLTESKVRSDVNKSWTEIDKDKDGVLSLSEFAAYEGKDRFSPPEDVSTSELGAAEFK